MKSDAKKISAKNGTEPSVGFTPVPVVVFLFIGILFFLGQLYLDRYAGGFNANVYGPYKSWKMVQDLQPKGEGDVLFAKGRKLFNDVGCVACHQASGMGAPGMAPPLTGSEWVLAPKPERLVHIVHLGLTGPITVKGVTWNNLSMASFSHLSDEDIAALLTYIRRNPDWSHNASEVTVEQVKAARDPIRNRQSPTTSQELQSIPEE